MAAPAPRSFPDERVMSPEYDQTIGATDAMSSGHTSMQMRSRTPPRLVGLERLRNSSPSRVRLQQMQERAQTVHSNQGHLSMQHHPGGGDHMERTSTRTRPPTVPQKQGSLDTLHTEKTNEVGVDGFDGDADDAFDWFHEENPSSSPDQDAHDYGNHHQHSKSGEVMEARRLRRRQRFCGCSLRTFHFMLGFVAAVPGMIAAVVYRHNDEPGILPATDNLGVRSEIERWSAWLSASLFLSLGVSVFTGWIPWITLMIFRFFGGMSDRALARLEFCLALRKYIVIAASWILSVVAYTVLFAQHERVSYWETIYRLLLVAMAFHIVWCFFKILLHYIAVRFHQTAYAERLERVQLTMDTIDQLRKSLKPRSADMYPMRTDDDDVDNGRPVQFNLDMNNPMEDPAADKTVVDDATSRQSAVHPNSISRPTQDHETINIADMSPKLSSPHKSQTAWQNRRKFFSRLRGSSGRNASSPEQPATHVTLSRSPPVRSPEMTQNNYDSDFQRHRTVRTQHTHHTIHTHYTQRTGRSRIRRSSSHYQVRGQSNHSQWSHLTPGSRRGSPLRTSPDRVSRAYTQASDSRHSRMSQHSHQSQPSHHSYDAQADSPKKSRSRILSGKVLRGMGKRPLNVIGGGSRFLFRNVQGLATFNGILNFQQLNLWKKGGSANGLDIAGTGKYTDPHAMQLHVGKLAKQLFSALRLNHDDTVLSMECFLPWFPSHEDAQAAFKLFDSDESGEISRKEMREAILKGYRERRALFSSLHNLTSAVAKLDQFFLGITVIITAFASMGIYKVSLASITPFTSLFLAFSFVFSGTLKNVFESVLFFFVSRPFDPYDMVVIDAMLYTVEEMGLMTTLLRAADNKLIYMPNSLLMSKQIQNLQRSTEVAEMVEMTFSIETSESKLRHLRARLFDWVQSQKREFMPYLDMKVIDLPEFKNIKVQFMFKHRGAIHHRRRTDFMFFLRTALIDLNFIADPKEPHAMSPLPPPAVLEPAPVTSNAAQFATASDLVMVSGYT